MGINANVSGGQQITASVGETKIDVAVSGGVGPSGAGGPAATITVGTVTTGAPGSSASVVNAGTTSAAVLNFTIPAGATGATGATGPQGATGPAGTTTWAGITDKPSTFTPSSHQHVAADISDFTSAVIAAAPPTTNASLLTSGTLPDARLSANIARTSDVSSAVAAVVNAAPAALDTLNELAAALGNDASFATTVTNSLAGKANTVHTHTVSAITDAGTAATRNVPATGNASSSEVVLGSDTRLTDARTPTSHAHGFLSGSGDLSTSAGGAAAGTVALVGFAGGPSAGKLVAATSLVGLAVSASSNILLVSYGTTALTACQGNDARLSDARTPLAHKSSHATGGTDALTPADIGASAAGHTHTVTDVSGAVSTSDSRLTDARIPTGAAGGDLTGTYPNPTIAPGAVITADIADAAVTTAKLADASVTMPKISATGSAGASTFLRGDGAWATPSASVTYATTAQAQDLTATTVAMSPDNVRRAITSWRQVAYHIAFTANGAVTTNLFTQSQLTTSSTVASSSAALYVNTLTYSLGLGSGSANWTRPIALFTRVYRQACPTNGVFRYLLGTLASGGFAYETLSNRGIGFEIRQSRLWIICHNGTSLTQFDTGIDSASTDFSGTATEVFLRSDGAGNVTISVSVAGGAVQTATTTGGPATQGNTSQTTTAYAAVTNGASAANAQFFFTPHLLYLPQ